MKILFLTDNFPPEVNAPASRTYEHCKEWVSQGVDVTVITCVPNFPFGKTYTGYKNKLYQEEVIDDIKVVRVWTYMVPNTGFFLRTLDFISFSIMSFFVGLFKSADIVMATSPQFFTALSGRALSVMKRKPYVLEIRDLWPEQLLSFGKVKKNLLIKYFEWEEIRCYRKARLIVSVTESYVNKISERGIDSKKIIIIKNGVDKNKFKPIRKDQDLLSKYNLNDKFIVGFIGTHGMSQNLSFIIDCIASFNSNAKYHNDIHFLFIGEGADKKTIMRKAVKNQIFNITFVDQVSKEEMPNHISLLDISLVPLRRSNLYLSVIPSKIFELAAMNIPILLGVNGEARNLIEKYNCGLFYEPENKNSFLSGLTKMVYNKNMLAEFRKGGELLSLDYSRKSLANMLLERIKLLT